MDLKANMPHVKPRMQFTPNSLGSSIVGCKTMADQKVNGQKTGHLMVSEMVNGFGTGQVMFNQMSNGHGADKVDSIQKITDSHMEGTTLTGTKHSTQVVRITECDLGKDTLSTSNTTTSLCTVFTSQLNTENGTTTPVHSSTPSIMDNDLLPAAAEESQTSESECAGAADLLRNAHDRSVEYNVETEELLDENEGRACSESGSIDGKACSESGSSDGQVDAKEVTKNKEPQTTARILRHRSNRRPVHERFRQKRQTLQDMARPLKHWLYRHRANPYPTREEKTQLAHSSAMTLTQVSNWFANARRRLKNTVQDPSLSWGRRIKLYNSCVEGNAERLSVCSDDDEGTVGEQDDHDDMWASDSDSVRLDDHPSEPMKHQQMCPASVLSSQNHMQSYTQPQEYDACAISDDGSIDDASGHRRKYKASILQRYLQDACEVQPAEDGDRRRHPSGSLSSHDYEEWSSSSCSSPSHNVFEDQYEGLEYIARHLQGQVTSECDDMHFKEISAALALTTLKYGRLYVRP